MTKRPRFAALLLMVFVAYLRRTMAFVDQQRTTLMGDDVRAEREANKIFVRGLVLIVIFLAGLAVIVLFGARAIKVQKR